MVSEEKNSGHHVNGETGQMMRIVRNHKVFWTTVPIELPGGEGKPLRVGMSVALVGTDADDVVAGDADGAPSVYDKLYELARWLTSGEEPEVRIEIRRHDNIVFYLPDDLKSNRKEYVVVIRILHSEQFDLPMDQKQLQTVKEIESKLKELGCPKDHWKKHPINQEQ